MSCFVGIVAQMLAKIEGAFFRFLLNEKPFVDIDGRQRCRTKEYNEVTVSNENALQHGGYAKFDGTAALEIQRGLATDWRLHSDFVLDGWVRLTSNKMFNTILNYAGLSNGLLLRVNSGPDDVYINNQSNPIDTRPIFPINEWVYFAFVRTGSNVELWTSQNNAVPTRRVVQNVGTSVINPTNQNPFFSSTVNTNFTNQFLAGDLSDVRLAHPIVTTINKTTVPMTF